MPVKLGALAFLGAIYGQIAPAAIAAAAVVIMLTHAKPGFARLLEVGQVFWIPMLVWLAANPTNRAAESELFLWVIALIAVSASGRASGGRSGAA